MRSRPCHAGNDNVFKVKSIPIGIERRLVSFGVVGYIFAHEFATQCRTVNSVAPWRSDAWYCRC
jgi:hypothetical protein